MDGDVGVAKNEAKRGGPLELRMDLIDEDPEQPRTKANPGFSLKSLSELAASIRLRGVKTPISVRPNPNSPGRYLINHGARRFRACRLAGMRTIPGFIDNDYSQSDQVVENLHRNELTAREIADYIGRQLAQGMRKGEIARSISKSAAFVTQYVTLLDLPEPLANAFNTGRVKDVTIVNELMTVYRKLPDEVARWLADDSNEITRGTVRLLRDFLEQKALSAGFAVDVAPIPQTAFSASDMEGYNSPPSLRLVLPWSNPVLIVRYNGRQGRLLMRRRPTSEGMAWIQFDEGDELVEASLAEVAPIALVDEMKMAPIPPKACATGADK